VSNGRSSIAIQLYSFLTIALFSSIGGVPCHSTCILRQPALETRTTEYFPPFFSHNITGNNNRWALFWKSVIDRTDLIQFRHDDFPSNLDQTVIFLIQLNRFRYGRVYVIGSDRVRGIGRHLNIYKSIMELSRSNT